MSIADKLDASPKVISNWRDAWKLHSIQAFGVGAVLNAAVASIVMAIPPSVAVLAVWTVRGASILCVCLCVAGIIGRLLVQKNIKQGDPNGG